MESINISFSASGQNLTGGGLYCASNTVHYIIAEFDLGDNWQGFDSVRAVWSNDFKCISTVLDPDGSCTVPHEVLERRGKVSVNLVGSILEDDELTDRLTTYPIVAITVDANAKICGTETAEVTPSQFEQYVAIVIAEVEKVTGMTAVAYALPEGSAPTANYSGGVLTLGIPKGDTGATGNGISSVEFNEDYSLTFYFTDSEPFTTPSIRGAQGARGYGIASVEKIGSAGLVDTYRINFEDPSVQPTTFTVTNGEEGPQGPRGYTGETGNGIDRIELTDTTGAVKTYTIYFTDGSTYDFEVTDGEVTLAELASVLPTDTASGSIASFEDGSDLFDYLSCVVKIEPVQAGSGTPSPDNVRPITGWTGCEVSQASRNLFNGSYDVIYKLPEPIPKGTWVTASAKTSGNTQIYYYDENQAQIDYFTLNQTDPNDSSRRYRTFQMSKYESQAVPYYIKFTSVSATDMQFELSSEDAPPTAYEAPTLYNITWQTEAGTVYGGTVDVVTGVLTVDRVSVDLGTLNWDKTTQSGVTIFYCSLNGGIQADAQSKCSKYPTVTNQFDFLSMDKTGRQYGSSEYNFSRFAVHDSAYDNVDATAFKTAMNGVQLVYELATPQTYQLDPVQVACLLGQNNVWADCGDIEEVKYKADVQKWVEKQLREINTAILALS